MHWISFIGLIQIKSGIYNHPYPKVTKELREDIVRECINFDRFEISAVTWRPQYLITHEGQLSWTNGELFTVSYVFKSNSLILYNQIQLEFFDKPENFRLAQKKRKSKVVTIYIYMKHPTFYKDLQPELTRPRIVDYRLHVKRSIPTIGLSF